MSIEFQKLLSGCESEQLHLSAAIQPFGALLCLDSATLRITHASANIETFLGKSAEDLLGQPMDVLHGLKRSDLHKLPTEAGHSLQLSRIVKVASGVIDAVVIRSTDALLIELEYSDQEGAEAIPLQQLQRPLLTSPFADDEVLRHHNSLLAAFRTVTGYDRVMLYQFHEDWSGEVIAEATSPALGSYLGLHFPASDIPEIARNLYMLNPTRLIPDITAVAVPILGSSANPPDLTWSNLRSVSPIHLQYLENMGIGASFSVPIRIANKLWGLVACHHLKPRMLSHDRRQTCVSLTNTYALGLSSHFASRRLQLLDSFERRIDRIMGELTQHDDPLNGIEENADLLMDVLNAQGFAMAMDDEVVIAGEGPDMEGMSLIDAWFLNEYQEGVASTNHLESLFPGQLAILAVVSGMIAIKARSSRSGWVRFYWFRSEEPHEVVWAGNPNKPVVENAGAITLSPRRSFERWVEIKSGYSRPWSDTEKMTAAKFRNTLLRWL
ncbi:MAG: GAF domain-containing protein [Gammaproteobacteria bacterium]|nr:GAF domain-containing protein [Gammaproteobacteria bacterium]